MDSFLQNRPSLATADRYTLQPAIEPGFQPFLRPTSPFNRESSILSKSPTNGPLSHDDGEPQIELVDRDGCVDRIVVTCTCCKRIELQCEY